MKSERRHELEKNVLADRLASGIESTRSMIPAVLGGLGVLAILAIGWGIYSSYSKNQASTAWTEFYFNLTSSDADSFLDVADDHPKSAAAGWARQIAGDNYLQRGIIELYRNKAEGKKLIGQAIEAFESVDQASASLELRGKALLGLAQAHESLGDIDKASSYYQQLTKTATQPGLITEANQRLAFLTSPAGKDFYAWFGKLDPKPDAPITLPSDLTLPPSTPDLQFGPTDTELNNALAPAASPATVELPIDTSVAPDLPAGGNVPEIAVPASEPPASEVPQSDAATDVQAETPPEEGKTPPA